MAVVSFIFMILGAFMISTQLQIIQNKLYIKYTSKSILPIGIIHAKYELYNKFFEETQKYQTKFLVGHKRLIIPLTEELKFGEYEIKKANIKLMDMLGLFSIHKKIKINPNLIQTPLLIQSYRQNNLYDTIQEKRGDENDDYDIREYRQGDSLKSIHYKISYKLSKLMVKEKIKQNQNEISIFLDLSGQEEDCIQVFSFFEKFIECLQLFNEKCEVYWISDKTIHSLIASSTNDTLKIIQEIISMPKMKEKLPIEVTWTITPSGLNGDETYEN
ncbi:MAG: DUF58 domain-containing protein [Traorella sp.]